jgi:hypothetical protein
VNAPIRPGIVRVWLGVFCGLFCLASAHAKMTIVTLSELIRKSDVIVFGHVKLSSVRVASESPSMVLFVPEAILKGKVIVGNRAITFCNPHGEEEPDLSKYTGALVIFATKRSKCLYLSHGDRSIVPVEAGVAHTVAIEDQPEIRAFKAFREELRALVARQAAASS